MNSIFRLFLMTLVFLQWSALPLRAEQIQENWKPYIISTTSGTGTASMVGLDVYST